MLCHQMAAIHFAAMQLLEHSGAPGLPPTEQARLTNAAARMIDVYQNACLTLQKLKTHGTPLHAVAAMATAAASHPARAGMFMALSANICRSALMASIHSPLSLSCYGARGWV